MIDGLEQVLAGTGLPGITELRGLLKELLGDHTASGRFLEQHTLGPREGRVFRLRFVINGQMHSLIVKRLKPEIARRTELVAKRWLPTVGLNHSGPPLAGAVAERSGVCVWHVYDDLGAGELDPREPDKDAVGAAIELVASMHSRFAGHALLGEVRKHGEDFGIRFYESNVRDAIYALEALKPAPPRQALCDRLLARLYRLRDEIPRRAAALASLEVPETLLHGDLWAINVFVIPTENGLHARLIDWDHAGVGPLTYDLSTLLLRFPAQHRPWMLELYAEALLKAGWRLPPLKTLNLLFETHEFARYANCAIWPAIDIVIDGGEWGFDTLEEIDGWFETFESDSAAQHRIEAARLRKSPISGGDELGAYCETSP